MFELGVLAALGAAAVWAISSTMMATQLGRLDSGSVSAIRLSCAALFFLVVLFVAGQTGEIREMGWNHAAQLILSALLGLAIGDTIYVAAMGMVGMARAFTISLGVFTVLAYAFSIAFLGDRITVPVVIGSMLVLTAIYLVALRGRAPDTPSDGEHVPVLDRRRIYTGLAMVLVAGALWAAATVWTRAIAIDYGTLAVGAVRMPAAAVLVSIYVGVNGASAVRKRTVSGRGWLILAIAGIGGTGLGGLLFIYALKEAGAGRAAVVSSMSPLFALPLGALILKERITVWVAVGTVLAVCGIVLLSL